MPVDYPAMEALVQQCLLDFQTKRLDRLQNVAAVRLLSRKNPYLFAAAGIETLAELADSIFTAFLSSSEETILGNAFFEPVALAVSGGTMVTGEGVDIVIEDATTIKPVAVKSGPSVFNASSKSRQNSDFVALVNRLRSKTQKQIDCVVGYAYGTKASLPGGRFVFREVAGQAFWTEMSGDPAFYSWLLARIYQGNKPYADLYRRQKAEVLERLVSELSAEFANPDGTVNWDALLARSCCPRPSRPARPE